MMNIWMSGSDMTGQLSCVSQALQTLGHHVSYNISEYPRVGYQPSNQVTALNEDFTAYDVFHIGAQAQSRDYRELTYAAMKGRIKVVQFFGPDIRTEDIATYRNPYARLIGGFADPIETKEHLLQLAEMCPACIVSDFELVAQVRPYFKRVYVLPYASNPALNHLSSEHTDTQNLIISHAPVFANEAGTTYVREILHRLTMDGYHFTPVIKQGLTYEERIELYQQSAIVIDQLLTGAYSLSAVDAMSLGKPVITNVSSQFQSYYPLLPMQKANPATLYQKLIPLLENDELRSNLSTQGQSYVHNVHHPNRIAEQLLWIYERERQVMAGSIPDEIDAMHNLYFEQSGEYQQGNVQTESPVLEDLSQAKTEVFRLMPNRMIRSKRGVYASFNLAVIPVHLEIKHAAMRIEVSRNVNHVPIYRITRGWDRRTALRKKISPRTAKKRMHLLTLSKKSKTKTKVSQWECTHLAQYWLHEQLLNHGVLIRQKVLKTPYLDVTVSR